MQMVDLKVVFRCILQHEGRLNTSTAGDTQVPFSTSGVKVQENLSGARISNTTNFLFALTVVCAHWIRMHPDIHSFVGEVMAYLA